LLISGGELKQLRAKSEELKLYPTLLLCTKSHLSIPSRRFDKNAGRFSIANTIHSKLMSPVEILLVIISILLVFIFMAIIAFTATRAGSTEGLGNKLRALRKSNVDSKLAGVCAGLGEHTPIPAWLWRALFLLLLFCGGAGLLTYIIFALCMPAARDDL
jgi:phage shock protein PspC (stress-responsive transcriptional regulator)